MPLTRAVRPSARPIVPPVEVPSVSATCWDAISGRVRVLFGVEEFGQAGGDLVEGRGGVGQGREGERVRSADRSGGLDVREAGEAFAGCRVDAVGRVEYEDVSSGLPVCACLVEDG